MIDLVAGVMPWAIVLSALLVFSIRVMMSGRLRSARAESDGGSVLLSVHLLEFGQWFLSPIGRLIVRCGGTPDGVTWVSLTSGIGGGVAVAFGWFGLATLLGTIACFCDSLDGMVARLSGLSSEAGETLDAIVDRYSESAFFVGLLLYYRDSFAVMTWISLAMLGAFMVSYTSAKAEAQRVDPPRGLMRRSERAVYLLVGTGLTTFSRALIPESSPLIVRDAPIMLVILLMAVISNVSTFQRVSLIRQALRSNEAR